MKYSSNLKVIFNILEANLTTIICFTRDYYYIKENSHMEYV